MTHTLLDEPPAGWFPIDVMKTGRGQRWDWCALMIDVHPDDLKHSFCTVQESRLRIPGKHRSKEAAWDALRDLLETPALS